MGVVVGKIARKNLSVKDRNRKYGFYVRSRSEITLGSGKKISFTIRRNHATVKVIFEQLLKGKK